MKKVCKGTECRFYDDTRYYDIYNGKQHAYCRYTKEYLEVDHVNKVVLSSNKKCISDNILEESIEEKKTLSEKVTLTTGKTYDIEVMKPMIYGGESQEFGLRGGTQNVPGIVGIGKACEIYGSSINVNIDCTEYNRRFFYEELTDCMTKNGLNDIINVNGDTFENGCKVLNLHIKNVDAETLMILLNAKGMCVSAGSACRSHEQLPSRTLTSMSIDKEEARNSIRLSFSSDIKIEDLKDGARLLADSIKQLSIN